MDMQEKKADQGSGFAILAIVAIFVLILGTVMLFADEDLMETSEYPDLTADDRQKQADQAPLGADSDVRSVRQQSEG